MVKFDDFTNRYLKLFMNKDKIKFDFINEEKNNIMKYIDVKIKYDIDNYIIPKDKIKKLFDTEWVYKEATNNLEALNKEVKISWFHKVPHNIYLKCTNDKFNSFIERVHLLLNIINYLYDKKNTNEKRNINMYLILTPLKKMLEKDKIIGSKHINTGYTDFITNEILCWREEEFEKVIFHEIIHYMDLDTRNMAFNDDDLPHQINGYKSYFEAFTDFWAIIYHTIYVSIILKKSVISLFNIEYRFMENQANLMNDYFGLGDWSKKKIVNQKSPAFSYFIIKFLIFKKVINSNDIHLINKPRFLIENILSNGFEPITFIDIPPRMTLLQLY